MGKIIEHKIFGRGRTKNSDPLQGRKIRVYFDGGRKMFCNPENLTIIGY